MLPVRYRVTENRRDTADTHTLDLTPLDEPLSGPRPGQFTMVYAFGVGEIPLSVSGYAADGDRALKLTHTVRAVGAVSAALCRAEPGTVVGVRGPFGTAWDVARSRHRDLLFVAGGIGLAPLRPPLLEALAARRQYRSITVIVGARTPEEHLYLDEDELWRACGATVLRIVDRATPTAHVAWTGPVGLVTDLLPTVPVSPERTTAYLCGPEAMMTHTGTALTRLGMLPADIEISLERNMRCGVGVCGHCQLGPDFVCLDGPVTTLDHAAPLLAVAEL